MDKEYEKDDYDYCYECRGLGTGYYVDEEIELNHDNVNSCDNCEK